MEHSDHWEQLQRHGSLQDTYLCEDPPHIRKMFLVSCLRSLLYADTVAANELEQEERDREKLLASQRLSSKKKKNSNNNSENADEHKQDQNNENNSAVSQSGQTSQDLTITVVSDNIASSSSSPSPQKRRNSFFNPNQTFNDQMHNTSDGVNNFFMSIVAMLRICESPDCETGEATSALRVLGPHNVVLSWIARPRMMSSGINNSAAAATTVVSSSTVGPAQSTDDWCIAVMCDGCIQKSLAKMSNVGPPVKPETAESLALERRRSAFLLVDVTSWPSWAGSVQYAPWLNIKWTTGSGAGCSGGAGALSGAKSTSTATSRASTAASSEVFNSSISSSANPQQQQDQAYEELQQQQHILNSTFGSSGATIEEAFVSAIKSSFEAGLAQGLFLLPGNRESITMNLENLIFFGYGCAHRDEPDIIRTALRNPSIYPVLFHHILPSLRGLELWRNRTQTPAQVEAGLKLKKEQEKRRKKLLDDQKKKREKDLKEQKEREKKGLPPIAAVTTLTVAEEATRQRTNSVGAGSVMPSDFGKPLEWVHAIEYSLLPLRHPALCHFSTHCESLQPTSSSSTTSIKMPSSPGKNNDNDDSNNSRGDEDGNDHGASFSLLVDAEEKRFQKNLSQQTNSALTISAVVQIPGISGGIYNSNNNNNIMNNNNNNYGSGKLLHPVQNNSTKEKRNGLLLQHNQMPFPTSAAFISIHCFMGGDVSLDSISAWHLVPPKFKVNSVVLELNRNDNEGSNHDSSFVPRMIQSMQFQLVGLHLVDCSFSTWTDFFTDFLVLLPRLQSLKMMCCRSGLEDAVQENTSGSSAVASILNYYSQQPLMVQQNIPGHSRKSSSIPQHAFHSRTSSSVSGNNNNTNNNNNNSQPLSNNNNVNNNQNSASSGNSLQKYFGTLKDLRHVELRSVPIDSKVIARFFDIAPNITSFVFPPNAIRRQQMQQNGFSIDPQSINLLTERMYLQLMNNAPELKSLEILAECPGELFSLNFFENQNNMNNNGSTPRHNTNTNNNNTNANPSSSSQNLMNVVLHNHNNTSNNNSMPSSPSTGVTRTGPAFGSNISASSPSSNNNNNNNSQQQQQQQDQLLRHQQKHNFTLDFWSRFKNLQKLKCQGWLSRSMLHAVAHLPNVDFIDGASSLDLTRADLFEACLVPAFRKEGRLFVSLQYLDVSFCHRLFAASGKTLADPVDDDNEKSVDERIASLIRQTFPDREIARRMATQQHHKKQLLLRAISDDEPFVASLSNHSSNNNNNINNNFMNPQEIQHLYGSSNGNVVDEKSEENNNNNKSNNIVDDHLTPRQGSVHSSDDDNDNNAHSGDMKKNKPSKSNNENDDEDDDDDDGGSAFQQIPDPYPHAPKLKVLCQRGFRNVPRSLLNLEVELLTSCQNDEEDGHKVEVIDMRSIKMTDEERELVTYQFDNCGIQYLLADAPAVEMADVILPNAPTPKAINIPSINFLGQTPPASSSATHLTGRLQNNNNGNSTTPRGGKPTPRSLRDSMGNPIMTTPSRPTRNSEGGIGLATTENGGGGSTTTNSVHGGNDNGEDDAANNNSGSSGSDEKEGGEGNNKKKCVIQ